MTRETRGGLPKSSGETKIGRTPQQNDLRTTKVESGEQLIPKKHSITLFVGLGLVIVTTLGGAYFLINAPLIDPICRQMGNCQKFKEDSDKAQESFRKAEKNFKSNNSLPEMLAAAKSVEEAKAILSTIPDNANELVPPIAEQRNMIAELDKKIAILLTLEENADKSLKEAIAKTKQADALNRDPQGTREDPNKARTRLTQPKTMYIEAQSLLKSIPDKSLVGAAKKTTLTLVSDKIRDLDNKLNAIKSLDPCVVNPDSCKPVDDPASCQTYVPPVPPAPSRRPLFGPGSY